MVLSQNTPQPYLQTPTRRQLRWHQLEYYGFVHFGPNTFTGEEWGTSQSTPDVFSPTGLDTDQWARTFADAGMAGFILTAKHHDGMALWDTNTTAYKIGNGNWAKDRVIQGQSADVVKMSAISAKKYGLKFGIYLSPWDIHRDPVMPKTNLTGTIYDEPQIFGDESPGDYNEFYAEQLTELVTMTVTDGEPVQIFEVWLDGASGSETVQTFNWTRFRDIIRQSQPDAIMWGHQGVDARWVGNEDGTTVTTNWHAISRTQDEARYTGEELEVGVRDGLYWTPAESDARLRDSWFFHPNETIKSSDELMNMYLKTVGQSVSLLLDVPPDMTGQISEADAEALFEFKARRDAFLNRTLLTQEMATTASAIREEDSQNYGPQNILDTKNETYWAMDDDEMSGWVEIDLGDTMTIDAFVVQEQIALGQRIGGYEIHIFKDGSYETVVTGTSMGYKRIHTMTASVQSSRLRLNITQANASPLVCSFQALGRL